MQLEAESGRSHDHLMKISLRISAMFEQKIRDWCQSYWCTGSKPEEVTECIAKDPRLKMDGKGPVEYWFHHLAHHGRGVCIDGDCPALVVQDVGGLAGDIAVLHASLECQTPQENCEGISSRYIDQSAFKKGFPRGVCPPPPPPAPHPQHVRPC